jgi:hypothetical protein
VNERENSGASGPGDNHTRREKMTEKKFLKAVNRLGGIIDYPSCIVDFPNPRIETKKDALDLLSVLRNANCLDDCDTQYIVNLDTPLDALKTAIKRGNL